MVCMIWQLISWVGSVDPAQRTVMTDMLSTGNLDCDLSDVSCLNAFTTGNLFWGKNVLEVSIGRFGGFREVELTHVPVFLVFF